MNKNMKKSLLRIGLLLLFIWSANSSFGQIKSLNQLRVQLESIVMESPGLAEKVDLNVSDVVLSEFLRTIAKAHHINLHIDKELTTIRVTNNFINATVTDVLIFVCKEYDLSIDITGNILAIKKIPPKQIEFQPREIPITYNKADDRFSIELNRDSLFVAFKLITDKTGNNIVFTPNVQYLQISGYIKEMPFDAALSKLAFSNNLKVTKTSDQFYVVEKKEAKPKSPKRERKQLTVQKAPGTNYYYKVKDSLNYVLEVDFENIAIEKIINDISYYLDVNLFVSSPLKELGKTTIKNRDISFDKLLSTILEPTIYNFQKIGESYYFGKKEDVAVRKSELVPLLYRSIEIMKNQGSSYTNSLRNNFNNYNYGYNSNNRNTQNNYNNRTNVNTNPVSRTSNRTSSQSKQNEEILSIFPDEVIKDLDIKTDVELNSFIVNGSASQIQKFKDFIKYIDKPIPVITIEVMILELNRSATVETGISWGIGEEKTKTTGTMFPITDMTIGSDEINKVISNAKGFGSLNVGKVLPEFYMKIKAMESNGDVKVRSTPKLSTLNGHRSNLAIGETTYYVVTNQSYYGSQIPQSSEIKNYQPIDAQLAIDIKPLVSGNGQITMEINVVQSSFNGERIAEDAPPGINSREFTSIVRVKDQEIIMLGGLEEKVNGSSGTGVPFLARVPVIKWLFSSRKKEDSKKKLMVLIKPTVIF